MFRPHLVGHHEHRRRVRAGIVRRERPADDSRNAEEAERVRRGHAAGQPLGPLSRRHQDVLHGPANHGLEDVILFLILDELGNLEKCAASRPCAGRVANLDLSDATGIEIGKGIQHHVVDDAEYRGRRTDAKRQRQDGQDREPRTIDESAEP